MDNPGINGIKADIELIHKQYKIKLDVSLTHSENLESRFRQKVIKHEKCFPIVFSKDYIPHLESLKTLKALGLDVEDVLSKVAKLIATHSARCENSRRTAL